MGGSEVDKWVERDGGRESRYRHEEKGRGQDRRTKESMAVKGKGKKEETAWEERLGGRERMETSESNLGLSCGQPVSKPSPFSSAWWSVPLRPRGIPTALSYSPSPC